MFVDDQLLMQSFWLSNQYEVTLLPLLTAI